MKIFRNIRKQLSICHASWNWIIMALFPYLPSRHIRLIILRHMGAKIASYVSMYRNVDIRCPKKLTIEVGSSIGPKVLLDARAGLEIGKNVTIAYDAIIWTVHHEMNSVDFHTKGAKVIIEDYAWLCSRSIILPGVKIGYGAVVASGAVVSKDVEPFAVVGGIPAKKIGERQHNDFNYQPYYPLHIV